MEVAWGLHLHTNTQISMYLEVEVGIVPPLTIRLRSSVYSPSHLHSSVG